MKKASLLAVTSEIPWPLDTGGHIRSFNILKALAGRFHVTLVAPVDSAGKAEEGVFRGMGIDFVGVAVGSRHPLGELKRVLAAMSRGEPYVLFRRHNRPQVRRALEGQLRNRKFDAIYLDHLDPLVFRDLFPPDVPVVADLHNVYSRLVERVSEEHSGLKRWYLRRESRLLAEMERRVALRTSALMAVSAEEALYFKGLGGCGTSIVPNGVDCSLYRDIPTGRGMNPPVILFVGALSWQPNAAAADFLARQVLPGVREKYPHAVLKLVGRNPGQDVLELARLDGVEVHANVPDIRVYLAQASLLAVALDSGGGTRLKILEAFAAGLPVLSTAVGCEGIECTHGKELWIAERGDFAGAAIKLIEAPQFAQQLALQARELVEGRYDWQIIGEYACNAVEGAL